jgi:TolA-binding protein
MNKRTKILLKAHGLYREQANDGTGGNTGGGATGTPPEGGATPPEPGSNKPSDAEAKLLKDLMKQKEAAKTLQQQIEQANAQLKNFEGLDPVKVRELIAAQEEANRKKLEEKGEYDRLVQQMAQRHATELEAVRAEASSAKQATGTLQQQIAELTVGTAFSNSAFVKESLTLTPSKARVIYGSHFEFKDGKVVGYDKPVGASERTPLVDGSGNALGFDAALKHLIEIDPDKEQLIRSTVKPGSGSGTQPAKGKPAEQTRELSSLERISLGLKKMAAESGVAK